MQGGSPFVCLSRRVDIRGRWLSKDEEFDEAGDEDHDGELAEEEALGEG